MARGSNKKRQIKDGSARYYMVVDLREAGMGEATRASLQTVPMAAWAGGCRARRKPAEATITADGGGNSTSSQHPRAYKARNVEGEHV
jgi:hypothetical protein